VPELLGRPDTLLFPHLGASTAEAEENCSVMAAEQLMDFLENGNVVNSVNYPQTRMARDSGYRITFANENVPRVLGTVLSVLADHDINVIDMVNKSLQDMAYNIIDVESEPTQEIIDAISAAEGVMHVRVL
jgi:D-3-phosphoglycerate dehydrogenase